MIDRRRIWRWLSLRAQRAIAGCVLIAGGAVGLAGGAAAPKERPLTPAEQVCERGDQAQAALESRQQEHARLEQMLKERQAELNQVQARIDSLRTVIDRRRRPAPAATTSWDADAPAFAFEGDTTTTELDVLSAESDTSFAVPTSLNSEGVGESTGE